MSIVGRTPWYPVIELVDSNIWSTRRQSIIDDFKNTFVRLPDWIDIEYNNHGDMYRWVVVADRHTMHRQILLEINAGLTALDYSDPLSSKMTAHRNIVRNMWESLYK